MPFKNAVASLSGCLILAVLVTGCSEPLTSESVDVAPFQLVGAPGTPVVYQIDLRPGVPINYMDCLRVDNSGTTHFHKCEFPVAVGGDLEDPAPSAGIWILSGDQDAQGNGTGGGPFGFTATWHSPYGDLTGSFEGHAEVKWVSGIGIGKLHGRGTGGEFWGLQMWGDAEEQGPPPGNYVVAVTGSIR